ncbi:MAG TPA: hypothetical protein VK013_10605 [Myxococcaceae bacterium]|nr:hypothetical protein [Myxococcaceae bacterium]
MIRSFRMLVPSVAIALALAGCPGPEDDHDHHGHDLEEVDAHVCEHFETQNSVQNLAAAADPADAPLAFEDPHLVYGIDFTGGELDNGSVRFTHEGHADGLLYLDIDVPVELTDASGEQVEPSDIETEPACGEVSTRRRYHLHTGSYILTFGASDETSVRALLTLVESDH